MAFKSYLRCATEPTKYRKDTAAVYVTARTYGVSEKSVWNARAKYPADPQKISDVQHVIENDSEAECRLLNYFHNLPRLLGYL